MPDYYNVHGAGLIGVPLPLIGFNRHLGWSHTVSKNKEFTIYELTLKAGDREKPSAGDCVVARSCIDVWYPTPNQTQELPPLPSWASSDVACSTKFSIGKGYGEMSVEGKSIECDDVLWSYRWPHRGWSSSIGEPPEKLVAIERALRGAQQRLSGDARGLVTEVLRHVEQNLASEARADEEVLLPR